MDLSVLLTVGGTLATGFLALIGTIWGVRTRAKVDVSSTITAGFDALTNQLQEERAALMEIVRNQRTELADNEKALTRCRKYAEGLESQMDKAGIIRSERAWD